MTDDTEVTAGAGQRSGAQAAGSPGPAAAPGPDRPAEMPTADRGRRIDSPQPRRTMPSDFSISLAATRARSESVPRSDDGRRQPMRGYEETFVDIVDFILRCTHRIWEEKAVGYLYEHYRSNTRVIDDAGMVYGRDQVIENTLRFLSAFPDLLLHADEIIWCGDEDTGFWTSHRAVLVGHNTGWSEWGPPTGRKIVMTCIANCHSIANQIDDEFVIYNTGSLLRQLGFDLRRQATRVASRLDRPVRSGQVERLLGQGPPPGAELADADGVERFVRETLHAIWNWRLLDTIGSAYGAGVRVHGPTDRELSGRSQYTAYVLELLAAFPDLGYQIDDLYWMGNDGDGHRVSVRWTMTGTHRGPGPYGEPTGVQVHMWGITHLDVSDGQILEEWTVSNEFDVLCQLAAPVDPDAETSAVGSLR